MTKEKLIEIMKNYNIKSVKNCDNAFMGLQILSKYTKNTIKEADFDIIYSENIDVLIDAGLSREDCVELKSFNWKIDAREHFYYELED